MLGFLGEMMRFGTLVCHSGNLCCSEGKEREGRRGGFTIGAKREREEIGIGRFVTKVVAIWELLLY